MNVVLPRFYVLQLLHPVGNDSQVTLFTCWGRVGESGQNQKKVGSRRCAVLSGDLYSLVLASGPMGALDCGL